MYSVFLTHDILTVFIAAFLFVFCDGSVGGDTVFTANVSQMKDVFSCSKKKKK